jgi:hypothetical protein
MHMKFGHRTLETYRCWGHLSNSEIAIKEIGHERGDWIHLAQNMISDRYL